MTVTSPGVDPGWLALREPADAAARDLGLVLCLNRQLATGTALVVHDLGCGTGSMGRWLAPWLPGAQHWILHDTDAELLARAGADPPVAGTDGAAITIEVRRGDITRLGPADLGGASLVTASALLDMFTAEELHRFVRSCTLAWCPVLLTLSVVGQVELTPTDPLDQVIVGAFNDHQQRVTDRGRLLGPAAVTAAADAFAGLGWTVRRQPSPWRLDGREPDLLAQWLSEWAGAAATQQPELDRSITEYLRRRTEQLTTGRLAVTVHHQDVLAIPP